MKKDFDKELLQLVKQSLPEAQAVATQELIEDYHYRGKEIERLTRDLAEAKMHIETYKEQREDLNKKVNKLMDEITAIEEQKNINDNRTKVLDSRESIITDRERDFKVLELQTKITMMERAEERIDNFFSQVFKNPVYKNSVLNR